MLSSFFPDDWGTGTELWFHIIPSTVLWTLSSAPRTTMGQGVLQAFPTVGLKQLSARLCHWPHKILNKHTCGIWPLDIDQLTLDDLVHCGCKGQNKKHFQRHRGKNRVERWFNAMFPRLQHQLDIPTGINQCHWNTLSWKRVDKYFEIGASFLVYRWNSNTAEITCLVYWVTSSRNVVSLLAFEDALSDLDSAPLSTCRHQNGQLKSWLARSRPDPSPKRLYC